jgi:putative ABC transport system ATP-binding protein
MNFFRRKPAVSHTNGSNGAAQPSSTSKNGTGSQFALVEDGSVDKAFAIAGAPPMTPVANAAFATNGTTSAPATTPLTPAAVAAIPAAPVSKSNGTAPTTAGAAPTNGTVPTTPPATDASRLAPPVSAPPAPVKTESRLSPELAKAAAARIDGNVNSTPVISVRDLKKIYQMGDVEVRALQGVDIDIFPGEITAIMGPSGSGKSTLMNIIGCLDVPSEGAYTLDGADVSRMNDDQLAEIRCHKIGFVFQSFNLLSRTTALANVELPLIYSGVGSGERHKRARAALELVGLGARLDHKPNELSGGQQQRVAIARALINRPAMILADEPTGNLDSKTSVEIMELFQRLNIEQGITIVFVTHNADTADYCHRTIRVRDGLVEIDRRHRPVAGIYSDPAVLAIASSSAGQYVGPSMQKAIGTPITATSAVPPANAPAPDAPEEGAA